MTTLFLCVASIILGYLARSWRIETAKTRAEKTADDALIDLAAETIAHAVTKERLAVAQIVCDTLAEDLAEALFGVPQPASFSDTPEFDATVVSIFRQQLDAPSEGWSL